jgi:hypothetical protein
MITVNPVLTTNAEGSFSVSLDGLMQGMAMDDPAVRFQLTGGQLAAGETLPMFGGIPICETIPPLANPMDRALQNLITRATVTVATPGVAGMITGISVFNQNHAMLNSVQSQTPAAFPGMLVNFYRLGSRARIPMQCNPAMNPAAVPGSIFQPLFWDATNQWIASAAGATGFQLPPTIKVIDFNFGNSMVVVHNVATGYSLWNREGSAVLLEI